MNFIEDTFVINGKELSKLEVPTNKELEASDVRLWLKPQVRELGIVVKASTEILIDPKNFVPTAGLVINGTTVVEEESLLALNAIHSSSLPSTCSLFNKHYHLNNNLFVQLLKIIIKFTILKINFSDN